MKSQNGMGFKGSKEWEVLNLLRLGHRDAFEDQLQILRMQRLTNSPASKIALCKLIDHVIKVDGQYAAVLIEDISHMLNDENTTVQNEALATFARTVEQFLLNIFLSDCFYPNHSDIKNSIADLACARHLIHHLLLNNSACDISLELDYIAISKLVHNGLKFAWANAMRVLMYELAFFGKLGILPHYDNSGPKCTRGTNAQEWYTDIRRNTELVSQVSIWASDDLALLNSCIAMATNSKKQQVMIRGIMATEAAITLIIYYPEIYFDKFAQTLVAAFTQLQDSFSVYEMMILRLFTSSAVQKYHPVLIDLLNSVGYACTLEEIYEKSHLVACFNHSYGTNQNCNEAIDLVSALKATHGLDTLINYATMGGDVAILDDYQTTSAARLFECNPDMVKNLATFETMHDYTSKSMRLSPTANIVPRPEIDSDTIPTKEIISKDEANSIQPTSCQEITQHYPLYITLLVTQMMDTAVSYKWHLKSNVVSCQTLDRFVPFKRTLFYKMFLGNVVPESQQGRLYNKLLDHEAHMVLLERANYNLGGSKLLQICTNANRIGVEQLMSFVAESRSLNVYETYLEKVQDVVMHKASVEIARGLSLGLDQDVHVILSNNQDQPAYTNLVNIAIQNLYSPDILDVVELRDVYIQQFGKFILNLPYIPHDIVNQLQSWLNDPNSIRLSFSLVSNLLKRAKSTLLKQEILLLFLSCTTSDNVNIKQIFLKLIASPKGLYQNASSTARYSLSNLESTHDKLVGWILGHEACPKCKGIAALENLQLVQDAARLSCRPFWQWPQDFIDTIEQACKAGDSKCSKNGCGFNYYRKQLTEPCSGKIPSPDWNLLSSVWIEELLVMLVRPQEVNAHPLLIETVEKLGPVMEPTEAIIVAASKNPNLLPFICSIANELMDGLESQAATRCHVHIQELVLIFRYKQEHDLFLISILSHVRTLWLDPRYHLFEKWKQPESIEQELVSILLDKMELVPEYILQLCPFLLAEQMEKLISHLFFKVENDEYIRNILELMLSAPPTFRQDQKVMNFAQPQAYMYACYKLDATGPLLKRQTGLLDFCIESCISGQFPVEAALSACTFIVESKERISAIFGRVLCQMVQKVPRTRSFVVQTILPGLVMKQAWQQQALWRGVVICLSSLWPSNKEPICKILLQLPQQHGEAAIKTLQSQHNATAYIAAKISQLESSIHIPPYIKTLLSL
ncbi:bifunctional Symplekin C-terminal/Armadillo-type fold [Babesia duncani]|uniref:Bifunctional Symplekin C-terminal/Armadillo-type fold n=1 Tax=Babesia duncani TaxID=323732 RepID=A0AAD9UQW5_9APIC|nr:bifunctional Symplekin C-terminal/Armadillo-type fold [Babesia duncani]